MSVFLTMFCGFFLQIAPFGLLCIYPFHNHFRFSLTKTAIITAVGFLTLGLAFSSVCCYLDIVIVQRETLFLYANVVFLICLLPCLGWYLYAIEEIWQKKLYIFTFTLTSALAITFIANAIDAKVRTIGVVSGLPYEPAALVVLFIITAIMLPPVWLLLKRSYMPVADGISGKEGGYLSGISLLLFAMLASGLIPVDYNELFRPTALFLYGVLLIAVFSIYFICFKLFYHAHESQMAQRNIVQMQHQMEINGEQYKRILNNIEISHRLRHDLRHHTIVLQGFLAAGELQKAEVYLEQFSKVLGERELTELSANALVNTVVCYYRALAKELEIEFTLRLDIPKVLNVQDSDLSVLLGNLLENAITAANGAAKETRLIDLNMICSGKMLAITVDNGFDGAIKIANGQYRSIKENHLGIGLSSIESIAEKYGGGVEFTHDSAGFHASVMLNVCNEKKTLENLSTLKGTSSGDRQPLPWG